MLMKVLTVAASVAMMAAPLSVYANDRPKPAEAEGAGVATHIDSTYQVYVYEGELHASDGDRSHLKDAHFKYTVWDTSGPIGDSCVTAAFTLKIHRDNDNEGPGGNLELVGRGLDCNTGGLPDVYTNGQSIQNFSFTVATADGCYSFWKQKNASGGINSTLNYGDNPATAVLHLDGNLLVERFSRQ
jgi:hypothetical protein